jgi:hypothetical protein
MVACLNEGNSLNGKKYVAPRRLNEQPESVRRNVLHLND